MADPLQIVMLAAEAAPFIKVGGLADVVGALPKHLEMLGTKVSVVIPAYADIVHDRFGITRYAPMPGFPVRIGPSYVRAEVFEARMPGTDAPIFFLGGGDYFGRQGVYDDPATREGFLDNMERFVFFQKAALELVERLGQRVDVLHCHDSQTGLVPGLLRTSHAGERFFVETGTLFTIHNLAYQSVFAKESLYLAGIDYRFFHPTSPFEFWGKVNFMKVGIECADLLSTVSETYAHEIQMSAEFGHGLEAILRHRRDELVGIVNGIDYHEWDPQIDPHIAAHYSATDLFGKALCKRALLETFRLPSDQERVPLVGIVSRLVDQKGFDLIADAADALAHLDLQIVVLGTGQRKYIDLWGQLAERYPRTIACRFHFDNALAHEIEAGADIFLMPSHYEPCGLNQLYSLRYGTVPVVRATGGLADTVSDYDRDPATGTGFSFVEYSSTAMRDALERALRLYKEPERWFALVRRAMSQDWSWDNSAGKYLGLYQRIWEKKHP